jgi:hypothetical protein
MRSMGFEDFGRELWPIAFVILLLGVNRYRQTLDWAWRWADQGFALGDSVFGAAGRSIAINSETVTNL